MKGVFFVDHTYRLYYLSSTLNKRYGPIATHKQEDFTKLYLKPCVLVGLYYNWLFHRLIWACCETKDKYYKVRWRICNALGLLLFQRHWVSMHGIINSLKSQ